MPDLDYIRAEIEHMRVQVGRHRKEILQLQRAGIPTEAADALLQRMLDKIDGLCAERDRLKAQQPKEPKHRVLGGRKW
ncbi:hypothetical protein FFI89_001035 [Bradyrhizobium sp. KBS0727]|nr:hypothetical protein FFI71_001035 [Bradyrhizobium sp. KBS0725]QDW42446.1 hypothetical protein FFI89_001035 [Bradyrhizobium sp. KBS0727]